MARLERGESEKIDKINDLVIIAKADNSSVEVRNQALTELLKMFKPLILSICKKWSGYFNDNKHNIKRFDEIVADGEYWFVHYTLYKYEINGAATFNTFIKNHLDQRIRYIYECELKYLNKNIFPDPDKRSNSEDIDMFESVAYNYSSSHSNGIEDGIVDGAETECREELAHKILEIIDTNGVFNERERQIFKSIMCDGESQSDISKRLGISRTRIIQIMKKVKTRLYKLMDNNQEIWDLVCKLDIDFKEL